MAAQEETIYTEDDKGGQNLDAILDDVAKQVAGGQTPPAEPSPYAEKVPAEQAPAQQAAQPPANTQQQQSADGQTPPTELGKTLAIMQKRIDDQQSHITLVQNENAELRGSQASAQKVQEQMNERIKETNARTAQPQRTQEEQQAIADAEIERMQANPSGFIQDINNKGNQAQTDAINKSVGELLDTRLKVFEPLLRRNQTDGLYDELAKTRPEMASPVFRELMKSEPVVKAAFDQLPQSEKAGKTADEIYASPMFHSHLAGVAKEHARANFDATIKQSQADQAQVASLAKHLGLQAEDTGVPSSAPKNGTVPSSEKLSADDQFRKSILNAGGGDFEAAVTQATAQK